jgi:dihydrofolate reductase
MRRIVMFNRITADGRFSGPDGSLAWVVPEPEIDEEGAEAFPGFDTILFGRHTYELFEGFWKHALDDSRTAPDPHAPGRRSPAQRAFAVGLNEMTKWVFSRTVVKPTWRNSQVIRALDPRQLEATKSQPGKDMILFGSGSIVAQLTEHGLIDEYQLVVCPILLGSGRPLFGGLPTSARLDLLESRAYPSGNVMLRYARAR